MPTRRYRVTTPTDWWWQVFNPSFPVADWGEVERKLLASLPPGSRIARC